jgi:opacity protein-like surface antigen
MTRNLKALGLAFAAVFAISAMAASAAQATEAHFTANSPTGNVYYTAKQHPGNPHLVLETEFGSLDCSMVEGTSTTSANTSTTIQSTVNYFGTTGAGTNEEACEAFGLEATVDMNGCEYIFHAGTYEASEKSTGTVDLSCPGTEGPTIAILGGAACTLTIHAQSGLGPVHYTTTHTSGHPEEITIQSTIASGVEYTAEGPFCEGSGVTEDGGLESRLTLKAYEDNNGIKGNQVDATITST